MHTPLDIDHLPLTHDGGPLGAALTLEQHNAVAGGLVAFAEGAAKHAEVLARHTDPRAVARREAQAKYDADRTAFVEGLTDAARVHGLAVHKYQGGGLYLRRRDDSGTGCNVPVELHGNATQSGYGYRERGSTAIARITIGDYGDKTSHPRPKAGWDYMALAKRIRARVDAAQAAATARREAASAEKLAVSVAERVQAATAAPYGVVCPSGAAGMVAIKIGRTLTEERAT